MKTMTRISAGLFAAALLIALPLVAAPVTDTLEAEGGAIAITPINHGSVQLTYGGKVIHVDPWGQGDYSAAPMADLILVTDIHGDHLDPQLIHKLRKEGAPLVVPQAAADQVEGETVMANGETRTIAGIQIEAIPMYNLKRGPEEGQLYHEKGRGNGYILTLGGKRIYVAGDTACTPEMRALENIDVAFVPMNLPYTMPPSEAAECVRAFAPKIVYPYHYRGSELSEFVDALKSSPGIEVRLRSWYQGEP
jgi:L-ascorbate metabolism protein UlaG (beta-lactamase superfamily)